MLISNTFLCLTNMVYLRYTTWQKKGGIFMEFRVLQYFLAVAREENISKGFRRDDETGMDQFA